MVWGWLIALVFIQCVACGMAELCSSMPTRYVLYIFFIRKIREAEVGDRVRCYSCYWGVWLRFDVDKIGDEKCKFMTRKG